MAEPLRWMYPVMQAFLRDRGGVWRWGRCDCVELLLHLVAHATGIHGDRTRYLQADRSYRDVVVWLSGLEDPTSPYLAFLETEAGLLRGEGDNWQVGVVRTTRPIRLNAEVVYPTDIAPGVIFNPPEMEPCILHRAGFSPITIYEDDVIVFHKFRLMQGA